LAKKYEHFYNRVLELTETGNEFQALATVETFAKEHAGRSQELQDATNLKSSVTYLKRDMQRIFAVLEVETADEAIDKVSEMKKNVVDPTELQNMKSSVAGLNKDIKKILDAFGDDVATVQEALTEIYRLQAEEKKNAQAAASSSSKD